MAAVTKLREGKLEKAADIVERGPRNPKLLCSTEPALAINSNGVHSINLDCLPKICCHGDCLKILDQRLGPVGCQFFPSSV